MIEIVSTNLFSTIVCSDESEDSALEKLNRECPSGTTNGWMKVDYNNAKNSNKLPLDCAEKKGFKHYYFEC